MDRDEALRCCLSVWPLSLAAEPFEGGLSRSLSTHHIRAPTTVQADAEEQMKTEYHARRLAAVPEVEGN